MEYGLGRIHGGRPMKKILIASVAAAAFCGAPAIAADMPVKAPMAAPYDPWTGFYAGGSVGARWSDVKWTTVDFMGNGTPSNVGNPAQLDSTSVRVGGYLGYNWKIAPMWLAGIEGDIAWADNKKVHGTFPGCTNCGTGAADSVTAKLDWDGSLRGRLGVLVNPTWLAYATGGVAWQDIKAISACTNGAAGTNSYCTGTFSGTTSTTKAGWTVGGGIETALQNHWLARAEYRYADFGHVANTLPPAPASGAHFSIAAKTSTALFGLAYKY
jgi:outer membrane immunogenic protein